MATKTRTQLINQALTNLLVIGASDTADAGDTAVVDALVDPLLEDLSARGVCYVPESEEIENALFLPLAELLANEACPAFAQQKNLAKQVECEERLRIVTQRIDPPNRLLQTDSALRGSAAYSYTRWLRGT